MSGTNITDNHALLLKLVRQYMLRDLDKANTQVVQFIDILSTKAIPFARMKY